MASERAVHGAPAPAPITRYADADTLAAALADRVAADLRDALSAAERVTLAVSGGNTPRRFFAQLALRELPWTRVTLVPVDDRWVPPTHDRSNERLIREHLMQGLAAAAAFVPLYVDAPTPEAALPVVAQRVAALPQPFAAVVLGLGEDGHTASWFPGGDRLQQATDPLAREPVVAMNAPGAPEPRITLTLGAIRSARAVYLHFEGMAKFMVFERALAGAPLPVGAVLHDDGILPRVVWCA